MLLHGPLQRRLIIYRVHSCLKVKHIQFEIMNVTFSALTAEQSFAGRLRSLYPVPTCSLLSLRLLIKRDWVISLPKVINVSNSPSSHLPTLARRYPDPEHKTFYSQKMISITCNEVVMTVFVYDEASKEAFIPCGNQRKLNPGRGCASRTAEDHLYSDI